MYHVFLLPNYTPFSKFHKCIWQKHFLFLNYTEVLDKKHPIFLNFTEVLDNKHPFFSQSTNPAYVCNQTPFISEIGNADAYLCLYYTDRSGVSKARYAGNIFNTVIYDDGKDIQQKTASSTVWQDR